MKLRKHADYDFLNTRVQNGETVLPTSEEMALITGIEQRLDLRNVDCSNMDLSTYNPRLITFDSKTIFPKNSDKLPQGFNPSAILEERKNPGVNVRNLHAKGITGKGISVAIIDQTLGSHREYADSLVFYKEFDEFLFSNASMHGSAVTSILVGKTCGIAPEAKVYYYSAQNFKICETSQIKKIFSHNYAAALNDILNLNETLPADKKIQAVSVSWGEMSDVDGKEEWIKAFNRAKETGVAVICTSLEKDYGLRICSLGLSIEGNPDNPFDYVAGPWKQNSSADVLAFPVGNKTFAAPQGDDVYMHASQGTWSWVSPYYTGLFALAKQVNKDITLEAFHQKALQTGCFREGLGTIVQPEKLIESLQREQQRQPILIISAQDKNQQTVSENSNKNRIHIKD